MQIANILENKDPYTKDHSARVAKYSLAIGEQFFGKQYDELYYCGSPFRWKFNEDEEKRFLFIRYDMFLQADRY